jgi:hypothetical protein
MRRVLLRRIFSIRRYVPLFSLHPALPLMDTDALLAHVPTTEQAAVCTRWRDLRGRIVTEVRTAPEDCEGLCKEKEAWLGRWCALWVHFLLVWRETELTVVALGQVELSALCKDSDIRKTGSCTFRSEWL